MNKDVVVIGAGLAGSSLAAALASAGWDVLLVERDRFPRHKVCGEFLSPEAQSSLHALGLLTDVAALEPIPVSNVKLVTQRGTTIRTGLPGAAWGISRYALDPALANAAQQRGAELWTGATVKSYTACEAGYAVQVRSEAGPVAVQARMVVAACGRHTQPGLPPTPRTLDRRRQGVGVKCHYAGITMPAQVELFLFPGGYVGINPVEGGRVNVCLLASYTAFVGAGKGVQPMLAAAARANPELRQRLAEGYALPATESAVAPVDTYRPAAPWDGIPCVGDAAVMIPPLCGDGMAMALRSAELCTPLAHAFLQGTLSLPAWQAAYSQIWHAEFDHRLRIGRLLQRLLGLPLLADLFVRAGQVVPSLATYLVQATRG